jgi:acetyl-CoA hydrolase
MNSSLHVKEHSPRIVTAEEAVAAAVHSGDRVFLTGNCSVPQTLVSALVDQAPRLTDVEISHALTVASDNYVQPSLAGHMRANVLFIGNNVRTAINAGLADYTPVNLSELPLLFKNGLLPVDVAFVHLSPPDSHGFCTYGIEAGLTISTAESAKVIVAEVNQQMPRTFGDSLISFNDLDYVVPVDYPLAELPAENGNSEVIDRIGSHIAELIPDGATLQLGIGSIPNAVLRHLGRKKDLGIHSELFSDGVVDLVERGVITCAQKTLHPGKIVSGFLLGTKRLYDWVDDNPMVELHRTEYVNHPFTIAQNRRMVALNSAIEVDLTGQVSADSIGTRFYSGVGGQVDFIYGASLAEEGVPIIALPSTTRLNDGTIASRIVPVLKPGAGVTTPRSIVHYVVTEFGAVNLYGKTIRQRAKLLISIAHPDFREELGFKAKELYQL